MFYLSIAVLNLSYFLFVFGTCLITYLPLSEVYPLIMQIHVLIPSTFQTEKKDKWVLKTKIFQPFRLFTSKGTFNTLYGTEISLKWTLLREKSRLRDASLNS